MKKTKLQEYLSNNKLIKKKIVKVDCDGQN